MGQRTSTSGEGSGEVDHASPLEAITGNPAAPGPTGGSSGVELVDLVRGELGMETPGRRSRFLSTLGFGGRGAPIPVLTADPAVLEPPPPAEEYVPAEPEVGEVAEMEEEAEVAPEAEAEAEAEARVEEEEAEAEAIADQISGDTLEQESIEEEIAGTEVEEAPEAKTSLFEAPEETDEAAIDDAPEAGAAGKKDREAAAASKPATSELSDAIEDLKEQLKAEEEEPLAAAARFFSPPTSSLRSPSEESRDVAEDKETEGRAEGKAISEPENRGETVQPPALPDLEDDGVEVSGIDLDLDLEEGGGAEDVEPELEVADGTGKGSGLFGREEKGEIEEKEETAAEAMAAEKDSAAPPPIPMRPSARTARRKEEDDRVGVDSAEESPAEPAELGETEAKQKKSKFFDWKKKERKQADAEAEVEGKKSEPEPREEAGAKDDQEERKPTAAVTKMISPPRLPSVLSSLFKKDSDGPSVGDEESSAASDAPESKSGVESPFRFKGDDALGEEPVEAEVTPEIEPVQEVAEGQQSGEVPAFPGGSPFSERLKGKLKEAAESEAKTRDKDSGAEDEEPEEALSAEAEEASVVAEEEERAAAEKSLFEIEVEAHEKERAAQEKAERETGEKDTEEGAGEQGDPSALFEKIIHEEVEAAAVQEDEAGEDDREEEEVTAKEAGEESEDESSGAEIEEPDAAPAGSIADESEREEETAPEAEDRRVPTAEEIEDTEAAEPRQVTAAGAPDERQKEAFSERLDALSATFWPEAAEEARGKDEAEAGAQLEAEEKDTVDAKAEEEDSEGREEEKADDADVLALKEEEPEAGEAEKEIAGAVEEAEETEEAGVTAGVDEVEASPEPSRAYLVVGGRLVAPCPVCKHLLNVNSSMIGVSGKCPDCNTPIIASEIEEDGETHIQVKVDTTQPEAGESVLDGDLSTGASEADELQASPDLFEGFPADRQGPKFTPGKDIKPPKELSALWDVPQAKAQDPEFAKAKITAADAQKGVPGKFPMAPPAADIDDLADLAEEDGPRLFKYGGSMLEESSDRRRISWRLPVTLAALAICGALGYLLLKSPGGSESKGGSPVTNLWRSFFPEKEGITPPRGRDASPGARERGVAKTGGPGMEKTALEPPTPPGMEKPPVPGAGAPLPGGEPSIANASLLADTDPLNIPALDLTGTENAPMIPEEKLGPLPEVRVPPGSEKESGKAPGKTEPGVVVKTPEVVIEEMKEPVVEKPAEQPTPVEKVTRAATVMVAEEEGPSSALFGEVKLDEPRPAPEMDTTPGEERTIMDSGLLAKEEELERIAAEEGMESLSEQDRMLVQARRVLENFMKQPTWEAKNRLVLHPEESAASMQAYYEANEPQPFEGLMTAEGVLFDEANQLWVSAFNLWETGNSSYILVYLVGSQERGHKVDWNWYHQVRGEGMNEFFAEPRKDYKTVRAIIKRTHYYGGAIEGELEPFAVTVETPFTQKFTGTIYMDPLSPVAQEIKTELKWNQERMATLELEWLTDNSYGLGERVSVRRFVGWGLALDNAF